MKQHPKPLRGIHWSAGILLALIAAPSPVHGAISMLEPTVVVGTRTPLSPDRITASVNSISSPDIERSQDRALTDTISRMPGMILWSNGGFGNVTSLSIRGTESNHTSLFLDGRRMSPGFGNQYDVGFLTPANAGSVEVQRGPSSVQYGSSNIGGVVDTRMRSGLGLNGSKGSFLTETGSNSYLLGALDYSAGNDSAGISLSTSRLSTDNERAHDAYEQHGLTTRFDYQLAENLLFELVASGFDNKKELTGSIVSPKPFDTQDTGSWLISPGIRYLSDELSAHLFYSRAERNSGIFEVNSAYDMLWNYLGDFPVGNRIEVISDELNLQVDYSLPDNSLLSVGAVYRNDDALNTNISTYSPLDPPVAYEESFQQLGLYAQLLWMLGERTELRLGLRHDDYSDYDDEFTGNVILIHQLEGTGTSLFAKVATAYAPPSAVDLAYDSDSTTTLNAERSLSYELGMEQKLLSERLKLSAVVFRNEIDDLLNYDPSTFDTFNVEQATTEGLELSANYEATEELELSLGYTYLRAVSDRLDDPRTFTSGDPASDVPLARRPRHLVQAGAYLQPRHDLMFGLQALAQLKREDIDPSSYLQQQAEDFMVLRLLGSWQLSEDWAVTGRIENLLDENYSSAAGYPALGRTFYLGAKCSF